MAVSVFLGPCSLLCFHFYRNVLTFSDFFSFHSSTYLHILSSFTSFCHGGYQWLTMCLTCNALKDKSDVRLKLRCTVTKCHEKTKSNNKLNLLTLCIQSLIQLIPLCHWPPLLSSNWYKHINEQQCCSEWHVPSLPWTWELYFILRQYHIYHPAAVNTHETNKCVLLCSWNESQTNT